MTPVEVDTINFNVYGKRRIKPMSVQPSGDSNPGNAFLKFGIKSVDHLATSYIRGVSIQHAYLLYSGSLLTIHGEELVVIPLSFMPGKLMQGLLGIN